ncbi:MAG TPA: glycosyltransferase family 4 protein [Vicinamibacterales bacterium]|nr:glycosyltransferase family 4 protein [Vicinamibacterales bacterium]
MKLLFIIDNLNTGGAQRQIVTLAAALRKRGHDATVFCYAAGDVLAAPLAEAGVEVVTNRKRGRYSLSPVVAIGRLIARRRLEGVVAFLRTPNIYAIVGARLSRRNPTVIVSERFFDPPQGIGRLTAAGRRLYRFADHVVLNSHHQRKHFERLYPHLLGRLSTIYNGVDLAVFRPREVDSPTSPLNLLAIGTVAPHKNGITLVRALAFARKAYSLDVRVTWVGAHLPAHEACSDLMKREIADLQLDDAWTWLPPSDRIPELIPNFHGLVHPSYGEGVPNVVCEAMACARPVLVSDALDHPHLVAHGAAGLLFDPHDAERLAECIKKFAAMSPHEQRSLGARARTRAELLFSVDRLAQEYESLLLNDRRVALLRLHGDQIACAE